jgi:phosphoribosylformylglycinamidine cyclo-ligase
MDYRDAGVDISAADEAKERIKALARATFNPGVLTEIGSFGGMFRPDFSKYEEPVLVASTDGVGTKIHIAILAGIHDTVGYDLVAHCVNDILVQGAVPLFFLDYIALGKMDPERVAAIVSGFARGCEEFSCPLLGGETAEMPGTYAPGDYDLAGFIVGIVDRKKALTGQNVRAGDVLLGLPSLGLHTNGYSLARKALFDGLGAHGLFDGARARSHRWRGAPGPASAPIWAPWSHSSTAARCGRSATSRAGDSRATSPACSPKGSERTYAAVPGPSPPLFRLIQKGGAIEDEEMYRTFNMGVGMVVVVAPEDLHDVEHSLERRGETSFVIGTVNPGTGVTFE